MNNYLNINSLPFLFTSALFFIFPLFVWARNKKSSVARSFFILGLSSSVWQFPYFVGYNISDIAVISVWYRIAYSGLAFVPSAVYHFIISFLGLRKRWLVSSFYAISFIFFFIVHKSNFVMEGARMYSWGSCAVPGPGYNFFLLLLISPFFLSLLCLYREYRKTESPYRKKRTMYFLITLPIAYLAMIDSFSVQGLNVYPIGFIPLLFFGISTSFAIVRYRLLDLEVIVKKATMIVSAFIIAFSFIYVCALYLQPHSYSMLGENWIFFPISLTMIVGFGLFNFINFVKRIQETELSKRFSYRPILKKEALRVSTARNINELACYLVRDLSSWVKLDYVGLFILENHVKRFMLARDFSRKIKSRKLPPETYLPLDSALVRILDKERKPLILSEQGYFLGTMNSEQQSKDFRRRVIDDMIRLNAEICIPCFCQGNLTAFINLGNKVNPNEIITNEDIDIFSSLSNTIARGIHDFMLEKEKTRLIVASQNTIISAIEARDSYTRGHTDRVAMYTTLIGEQMARFFKNVSDDLYNLNWSAQLHDVGKIGIPDSILLKPFSLSEDEWKKVKEHPLNGVKIVSPVSEWLGEDIISGILHHHENYDGSGYPSGQAGKQIHIFARIIRVADAFDAMTSDRPYRPALEKIEAFKELDKFKGLYFDPQVVDIFKYLHKGSIELSIPV
ncbi:MAG: HD domain-containing protein [Candidatus Omnitrophica bacterium]|nr:HD domain-containing protein [Candidatus Omnitrophota bacterium]